jgi:hypothetical protein
MNDTDLIFSSTDIFFFFPRLVDFDSLQKALAFNFDGLISIDKTKITCPFLFESRRRIAEDSITHATLPHQLEMHLENQIKSKENQLKENKQTNIVQAELAEIKWKSGIAEHWETGKMSFQFLPSLSNRESGPPALVCSLYYTFPVGCIRRFT